MKKVLLERLKPTIRHLEIEVRGRVDKPEGSLLSQYEIIENISDDEEEESVNYEDDVEPEMPDLPPSSKHKTVFSILSDDDDEDDYDESEDQHTDLLLDEDFEQEKADRSIANRDDNVASSASSKIVPVDVLSSSEVEPSSTSEDESKSPRAISTAKSIPGTMSTTKKTVSRPRTSKTQINAKKSAVTSSGTQSQPKTQSSRRLTSSLADHVPTPTSSSKSLTQTRSKEDIARDNSRSSSSRSKPESSSTSNGQSSPAHLGSRRNQTRLHSMDAYSTMASSTDQRPHIRNNLVDFVSSSKPSLVSYARELIEGGDLKFASDHAVCLQSPFSKSR